MALLRILHAAQMPDPGKLARRIEELAASGLAAAAPAAAQGTAPASAPVASAPALDWAALVAQVDASGMLHVAEVMRSRVRVIDLALERLVFEQADKFPDDPAAEVRDALFKVTGKRWQVERGAGPAQPSLREAAEAEARAAEERLRADPLVKAAFEAFPDAELIKTPSRAVAGAGAGSPPWN
jgi:DNA polymerase-3 subunit gamma/tau